MTVNSSCENVPTFVGLVLDRNINAAGNLLHEALRTTVSSTGSHACGESDSGLYDSASETALTEIGTNPRLGMS